MKHKVATLEGALLEAAKALVDDFDCHAEPKEVHPRYVERLREAIAEDEADSSGLRDYFAAAVNMEGVALSALEALEGPFPAYADAKAKQDWYARAEAAFRYHRADAMLKTRQS